MREAFQNIYPFDLEVFSLGVNLREINMTCTRYITMLSIKVLFIVLKITSKIKILLWRIR